MAPLRYLTPFVFLALLVLGAWLGGAWTFLAAAATPVGLMALDVGLGKEGARVPVEHGSGPRWFPRIYIALQLIATAWLVSLVARGGVTLVEEAGLIASAGVTTGVFGFVAAHEMIHSPEPRERALGLTLLGTVL